MRFQLMTFGVDAGTRDGRARNAIEFTGPAATKNVALSSPITTV